MGFTPAIASTVRCSGLATAICLALTCLPAAAQVPFVPGQYSPQSAVQDVIPFEIQNGLIVIKALLGDGLVADAIIDTGIPLCLISPDVASKRALKTSGKRDLPVLDRSVPALNLPPQALRINRMLVTGVASGVLDLYSYLSSAPPPDAPQVWLGNSALAALSITIDPRIQQITLRPAGAPLPVGAIIVPFELKDGRMWVDVKVNGKKNFSAMVDTGSVGTLLPAPVAKALALIPATTLPLKHPDGKEGKACAVDLATIEMAGLKVPDVQAIYLEPGEKDGFDRDLGIIGSDVLLRYRVTIDCARKTMAFEKLAVTNPANAANAEAAKAQIVPEKPKNAKGVDKKTPPPPSDK